ncbi:MAG: hypothetical protein GY777_27740 [Candidatus Brocadiaceae bacterium]|nr:hypothetical protein [Candidatus Brocadiaceae bacterium]
MNNYTLPKLINCKLTYNELPVSGLMLWAEFTTVRKNPYSIVFGPSDQKGRAILVYENIKCQAGSQLESAIMDFDPIDKAFSGTVSLKVMTTDDLLNAINAYELFKTVVKWYPTKYCEHLETARSVLQYIDVASVKVEVEPIPESVNVIVK